MFLKGVLDLPSCKGSGRFVATHPFKAGGGCVRRRTGDSTGVRSEGTASQLERYTGEKSVPLRLIKGIKKVKSLSRGDTRNGSRKILKQKEKCQLKYELKSD